MIGVKNPTGCGLYKIVERGHERVVAWVKGDDFSISETFSYPHGVAEAFGYLAEQAPGLQPRVAASLTPKEQ